ncbi:MAG: DUF5606 domain-containing protein [Flavobacteriales bacterium]|nr:DUF5606 domain-containing protein [Flavobacteriales bacterium]
MNLEKILAISGKPGLFKMIGQMKNGVVVESFITGKRSPAYATENISALEDISIYTNEGDTPLSEVYDRILDKEGDKKIEIALGEPEALKSYFKEVLPDYDEERVYVSDMKKTIKWYNLLQESGHIKQVLKDKQKEEKKAKKEEESGDTKKASSTKASNDKTKKTATKAKSGAKKETDKKVAAK